jgi:membrane-bound ClpP family serine protease
MDVVQAFFATLTVPVAVCFIVGLLCLVLEMFTPGFGVPGLIGIILLITSVVLRADSLANALLMLAIVFVVFGVALGVFIHSASKGRLSRSKLVLKEAINQSAARGDSAQYLGMKGVALTALRPAGSMLADGRRLDVLTDGEFIEKGAAVVITRLDGPSIFVSAATAHDKDDKEEN